MIYREHAPHPALTTYVACYWSLRGRVAAGEEQDRAVVPDACLDILFNLAPSTPGSVASRVIGAMTRPLPVRDAGALDLLGVRFRPGGAAAFVRLPVVEVTDDTLSLEDAWGAAARALTERLQEAESTSARLAILDAELSARLEAARAASDTRILDATGLAERAAGTVGVDALAHATSLGRRQLERRFLAVVGLTPKTACRVLRFQAALTRLRARPEHSLSRIALDSGYHDQAHFTRDFRAFAGVPPGAYRRTHPLPGENDAFVQDPDARAE
jgi:AraC-like DNA-binding protein